MDGPDDKVAAFCMGIRSTDDPDILLIWQIGVGPEYRGSGNAGRLLDETYRVAKDLGCRRLQVTIAADNKASLATFKRFARSLDATLEPVSALSFVDPIEKISEEETVYEIGLSGC